MLLILVEVSVKLFILVEVLKWLGGPREPRLQVQSYHYATYSSGSICESGLPVVDQQAFSLWLLWTDKALLQILPLR